MTESDVQQHGEQVFCRHCGHEIRRSEQYGYWVHVVSARSVRICPSARTFAEPADVS